MALASRKDLMRILTQPAQRKGLHHNLIDLLIDPLVSMHLLNEKMHEKVQNLVMNKQEEKAISLYNKKKTQGLKANEYMQYV